MFNKICAIFLLSHCAFYLNLQSQTNSPLKEEKYDTISPKVIKGYSKVCFKLSIAEQLKIIRLYNFKGWRHGYPGYKPWQKLPVNFTLYMSAFFKVPDSLRAKAKKLNLERVQDSFFEKINVFLLAQPAHLSPRDILWEMRTLINTIQNDTIFHNFVYDEFIAVQDSVFHQPFPFLAKKLKWFDYFTYHWYKEIEKSFWAAYILSSPLEGWSAFVAKKK